MSQCDNKYKELLHAYELGLLDEADQKELELHLMECESCFEELKQFKAEAGLLRMDPQLAEIAADAEDADDKHKSRPLIKYILSAAAVLLILLLKPWDIQFNPDNALVAAENKIMILPFENSASPEDSVTSRTLQTLLITDLAESKFVKVTPVERVDELLSDSLYSIANLKSQLEIGKASLARVTVIGRITKTDPLEVAVDLYQSDDRKLIGSIGEKTDSVETLFDLVDRLSVAIREYAEPEIEFSEERDRPVAEITSTSAEAYRYYVLGVEALEKVQVDDAKENLLKAIELDPKFAMAYYQLGGGLKLNYIDSALVYIDRAGEKDQYLIRSRYALFHSLYDQALAYLDTLVKNYPDEKDALYLAGTYQYTFSNFNKALEYMKMVLTFDKKDRRAYNLMTYCYNMLDDYDNAIITINKYIELYPDEANPYDTRGDMYANFGYLQKAKESYKKALEIDSMFTSSLMFLSYMYLYENDYHKADSCLERMYSTATNTNTTSAARLYMPYSAIRQGQFNAALSQIEQYIVEEELMPAFVRSLTYKKELKAIILDGMGETEKAYDYMLFALNTFRDYPEPGEGDSVSFVNYCAYLAGRLGKIDDIRKFKKEVAPSLDSPLLSNKMLAEYTTRFIDGLLAYYENDYPTASDYFVEAIKPMNDKNENGYFLTHSMLARSYKAEGKIAAAIEVLEKLNRIYTSQRLYYSPIDIENYYLLGQFYEASNWNDKAAEQYQLVITHWGNNDSNIAFVKDARQRLKRLQNL